MDYIEFEPKKKKNHFWKGALFGALVMFIICAIFGGAVKLFDGAKDGNHYFGTLGDNIVDAKTRQKLERIRALINSNYLYNDKLDETALQDGILKGYVAGLSEPYSVYYNEDETRTLFESTSGEFGGIGVVITLDQTTGLLTFTTIYEDAPGKKAGFEVGDLVYKVNGEEVAGMDMDTVVSKIRGEVGTDVEITVLRGENLEEYTGTATRALIENTTVSHEMKEDGIGYIRLTGFEEVSYKQFEAALTELDGQGMEGLVVDLRSNPGGNLATVCEILDLILEEGVMVSVKDGNGNEQEYKSDANCKLNVPLVVLINGYSASASEIFAGAVQDYGIGTLIGTTTYGKGIVQNIYSLGDGTSLKITSSEYFTPEGRNIHGKGIEPDVEVEYQYDEANPTADNQLDKALEVLKSKM